MPRTVPHAWKSTGAEAGRVLFLYTPAGAGKLFEEGVGHPIASFSDGEFEALTAVSVSSGANCQPITTPVDQATVDAVREPPETR